MHFKIILIISILFFQTFTLFSQPIPAAYDLQNYLPKLKKSTVGLVVNQTSEINGVHLADTLSKLKVKIKTIFGPEHGFRGTSDAGEKVNNDTDIKTGIKVISLYGKNKKPTTEQLKGIDVLVFDIQDVGARFYTYISTLHYIMEACAENNLELVVLDRPNPNGMYIDGPILDTSLHSFVGMHPIPVVHGLTVGELAQMINGEKWIAKPCKLTVVKCKNYTHLSTYTLPVKPSPNLPNDLSIALYPSLCLFEGTTISVGRGTDFPFQIVGAPDSLYGYFSFTPHSIIGMSKNPMHEGKKCFGVDLRTMKPVRAFTLKYVIDFYSKSKDKEKFFNSFFDKLIGNKQVMQQIKDGLSESEIKKTWQNDLEKYKLMRRKYLLYY
ncbi:MAG: DUF1343 domain-containing protein [Bacteroidetes bacterium]|nr:MAG: DUF1343 domain-containing protein [Bacteroidota bacterium]